MSIVEWELRVIVTIHGGIDMQEVLEDVHSVDGLGFDISYVETEGSNEINASFYAKATEILANRRFMKVLRKLREHPGIDSVSSYEIRRNGEAPKS